MNSQSDNCVLLFVKSPARGQVKTRLAAHIGSEAALRLYESFVLDMLTLLNTLNLPVRICFDPADTEKQFKRWLGGQYSYVAQTGRDLGERMKNAFVHSINEGFEKVALIGSDIPDLPGEFLREAFDALESNDAVIGPSRDGGYYLIGFSRISFLPVVFDGITWSTSTVFQQTNEIFKRHEMNVHLLTEWYDVDTRSDLQKLIARNKNTAFARSKTSAFIRHMMVETIR
jgi:rSAM/selenodomain-associated transferase 1